MNDGNESLHRGHQRTPRGSHTTELPATRTVVRAWSEAACDRDHRREETTPVESRTLRMDYGDEYTGEVLVEGGLAVPHGRGTLLSRGGGHCYVGHFRHRWRDGYGRLETDRYVLWSRWRTNRPDLTNSCRVDYANGDKYCGFLATAQPPAAGPTNATAATASVGSSGGGTPLSKFSLWVQSTAFVRQRWGELVTAAGDSYFGEWAADRPRGFGCYVHRSGDRYVGHFRDGRFHGTGVLLSRSLPRGGAARGLEGAFMPEPVSPTVASAGATGGTPRTPVAWSGGLCVYDGVWADGKFVGEGHVTLPGGARVSAEWRGASQPSKGEVVFAAVRTTTASGTAAARWRECFHWEPLLCGMSDERRAEALAACAPQRERFAQAATTSGETLRALLLEFLRGDAPVLAALRVFRRCFTFLYGTCGPSSEAGAGGGGNPLGWCTLRSPYGGCVHPPRGRPIGPADLDAALCDLYSFARSVLRWTAEVLGDDALARMDAMDASVNLTVGRWVADEVLRGCHGVLHNLYLHAYAAGEAEVGKALDRLRGRATLDDMGVQFARRHTEEQLFDPYGDAVHCIEQLGVGEHTLSSKLAVLTQWSREIDLSTRLAQAGGHGPSAGAMSLSRSLSSPLSTRGGGPHHYQAGSADDLLPIHQYVLSQCRLRGLHAHARMLADFAEEPMFVDQTSQEGFCVTNFAVCTLTLPRLHRGLRDGDGVLVPASLFADRLRCAVERLPDAAAVHHSIYKLQGALSAGDLHCAALGYAAAWMPAMLVHLAYAPRPLPPTLSLAPKDSTASGAGGSALPLDLCRLAVLTELDSLAEDAAGAVRLLCWQFAGSVLEAMGLALFLNGSAACEGHEETADGCPVTFDRGPRAPAAGLLTAGAQLTLRVPEALLPSFLLYARAELDSHL